MIAYVCWFTGLRNMPAGAVAIVGLLNPVMGTTLGVLLAAEAFGPVQALGMALVIGGVLAGQLRRRPSRRGRARGRAGGRRQPILTRTSFDFLPVSESTTRNRLLPS